LPPVEKNLPLPSQPPNLPLPPQPSIPSRPTSNPQREITNDITTQFVKDEKVFLFSNDFIVINSSIN